MFYKTDNNYYQDLFKKAVYGVMKYDGIVIGRLFVNQHIEKDCLYHEINKYSKSTKNIRHWQKA
ncbi:hypothetical protein [Thermoanaerobacterium butyriciformans]|uniref:Uncharacterized protein n=1 Tax=Thermoanaerobacterium butyriciformans TaxID=1702242 RepID=A0ABS4NG66_9THEO|nr:hypothetical protein [Thermoanaerobacterium butyriciformans]MBP2072008.1 hypothetical protein [Thermoanaerobacterium butyriciformans]